MTALPQETDLSVDASTQDIRLPLLRRRGVQILLALGVFGTLAAGAVFVRSSLETKVTRALATHTVTRGEVAVTIKEQGTLESARNTEIKCEIRGGYGGRGGMSTVTYVIPSGSFVKAGDVLVRLDTKVIEETISLGKTDTNNAKAALARAQADLAKADIAVGGYLEGSFRSQMKQLDKQLKIATRNYLTAQTSLQNSESLFQRGYVTDLEVEGNQYAVKQAALELNVVETQIDVLSRLTRAMQLETLNGQLQATKARVAGRKAGVILEQGKLDLAEAEFKRCVIRAPQDGLVIYPSTAKWKNTPDVTEGASVHNNQVLLLMPDLSQMQINVGIHESIVSRVHPGMPVTVTMPNRSLETPVTRVATVAAPAGWWNGNEVAYDATIALPNATGLRPGTSAEVEITLARYENVLSVPTEAVVEVEEVHYCWVQTPHGSTQRRLELGDSNDRRVVVESGLSEGEVVVLEPLLNLPEARSLVGSSQVHQVDRGELLVTLTEQGTLESSNNTQIKCRVRGASTVNWVIESGSQVRKGDELVRLENKQIEEFLHERTKYAHLSKDAAIGFRAEANRAELAISQYLEGTFRTELLTLQKDAAIAQQQLRSAQDMLSHARMMFDRGYVSELDVQQREFVEKQATLDLALKQTEIDVLTEYTKQEQLITLTGAWEAAKAAADGHEEVLSMDEARIKLAQEEIQRCTVHAERDGLVIYPENEEWKKTPDVAAGATVRNDQVLLLMPDLTQMQVKVGIHETIVDRIQAGMKAIVTLPQQTLEGEVARVASVAKPAGWWTGNVVKYDAVIRLPQAEGLKPGMSAEVNIVIDRLPDSLLVPVSAVIESAEGAFFCWVGDPNRAEKRKLELGDGNESQIAVKAGLQPGEQVLLHPGAFLEEARQIAAGHAEDASARPGVVTTDLDRL